MRLDRLVPLLAALAIACGASEASHQGPGAPPPASETSDETPPPPPLPTAEAGFVEVPAQPKGGSPLRARMFYSFRAADVDPATKPLVVMFNGGPGAATSAFLAVLNTGPWSVDLHGPVGAPPIESKRSLTEVANLLYVDERSAGFSYEIGGVNHGFCEFESSPDAAEFLRVVLAFIERHPALAKSKLVLLGESYGGMRATEMANMLLDYTHEPASSLGITELVQAWADRAFGPSDEPHPPDRIARQLAGLVLVQPMIFGKDQMDLQAGLATEVGSNVGERDTNDVRRPVHTFEREIAPRIGAALSDPNALRHLFGVDLDTIPELRPESRLDAHRGTGHSELPGVNAAFGSRLGALGDDDAYHFETSAVCSLGQKWTDSPVAFGRFMLAARHAPIFITNARYDANILSPGILKYLEHMGLHPALDVTPRAGVARPGWFSFDMPDDDGSFRRVEVRFPSYEAGHVVSETAGPELVEDVATWLHATGR